MRARRARTVFLLAGILSPLLFIPKTSNWYTGLAKRWSPGFVNAAGKASQKCSKQEQEQNSPNLRTAF